MTPDELEKEAERIRQATVTPSTFNAVVLDVLRAVAIQSFSDGHTKGHNAAIEKAAEFLEERDCECGEPNCCSGYSYVAKIRAIKIGDGK